MLLWHLDHLRGEYCVLDRRSGTVLVPPFFSNPDPGNLGRNLAANTGRLVYYVDVNKRLLDVFVPPLTKSRERLPQDLPRLRGGRARDRSPDPAATASE